MAGGADARLRELPRSRRHRPLRAHSDPPPGRFLTLPAGNYTLAAMRPGRFRTHPTTAAVVDSIHFNLILQAEFPPNALVLASEALRIANQNTGQPHFAWCLVSEDGEPVRASNGMHFPADCAIDRMPDADVVLLFEGNLPTQLNSRRLLAALRRAARHGAVVGGVDTGVFALAEAGALPSEGGMEVVLHWEAVPSFRERHPLAGARDQIYLLRGQEAYCAGGVATLDMMLELIAGFRGEALANEIADALVHTRRPASTPQRGTGRSDAEAATPAHRLVRLMEANLETPLCMPELAAALGLSPRTLGRLCQRTFGQPPMRLYLGLRLQAARNFLFYDEFSVTEVAMACGFSHVAVFSRVFRARFGQSPRQFRARVRARQNLALRPELQRFTPREPGAIAPPGRRPSPPAADRRR